MKYVKVLGLAVVVTAALLAFAGSASATILTGTGCAESGCAAGTEIKAELKEGEAVLKSNFIGETKCKKSTTAGKVTNAGGTTETVKGTIESLTFTECNAIVEVLKTGTLEVHTEYTTEENGEKKQKTESTNNGTVTSSGAEVTVEIAGFHCIFGTSNTDIGEITGGTPAVLNAHESSIPRVGGRSGVLCGTSASWNAKYKVTTPGTLSVD